MGRAGRRWSVAAAALGLLWTGQISPAPVSAVSASTPATTDQSVSFQVDAGHSGAVSGDSLAPPLARAWKVDLGGPAGAPLLADNRVFVIAGNRDWSGTRLFALDPASGLVIWGPIDLGGGSGGLNGVQYVAGTPTTPAYESGKVFATDGAGFTDAFDAATGALIWHTRPDRLDAYFNGAPQVINGTVYAHAYMSPGDRNYALNEADGSVRWWTNDPYGAMAASTTTLFLNGGCDWVGALDAQTGKILWRNQGYGSSWGTAPVLYQGRLYTQTEWVPQGDPANEILDAATGTYLGTFDASFHTWPAFDGGQGFWLAGGALKAVALASMTTVWTFGGDGHLDTSPVIANGIVYVGSSTGSLFGVSEATHQQVWSDATGTAITSWPEQVGLAVGQDTLAVPAGTSLMLYRSSSAQAPTPIAPVSYPPPAHGNTWATGDEATAFRIDPGHDANQAQDPLAPPLQQAWSIDLGSPISYPVIADGRVFASVSDATGTAPHTTLYALDRRTGTQLWSKSMSWPGPALSAYDGGVLYVLTAQDELSALDPATGAVRWSSTVSGHIGGYYGALGDPPIATGGWVYAGAGNIGGILYAFRESDGHVLWQKGTFNKIDASPSADTGANVYLTFGLNSGYSYTPNGQSRWNLLPTGADDASITAGVHQSKIYGLGGQNATRDSATGLPMTPFSSATPGAFDGDIGVFLVGHTLQAIDLRDNHVLWDATGDGGFVTEPVIAAGNVYEGSTSGTLFAIDDVHGATLWSGSANAPFGIAGSNYAGLAVAEGTLIAPTGTRLTAYVGSAAPPPTTFYFAEGYTGSGFSERLSLFMPNHGGTASIDYFTPAGHLPTKSVGLTAGQVLVENVNADVGPGQPVSAKVTLPGPGVVERTIHFNNGNWHGSTDKVGVTAPNTEWDFAEGSTYDIFSEYLTLQNPTGTPVPVSLHYVTDTGLTPAKSLTLPANSRTTVEVFSGSTSDVMSCTPGGLGANCGVGRGIGGVSVQVLAGSPIIAERPFYVNSFGFGLTGSISDGHDAFGANAPAMTWNFAEGTTIHGFKEYLTLQNPNATTDAMVTLTYQLGTGGPVKKLMVAKHSRVTVEVFNGNTSNVMNCVPRTIGSTPGSCGVGDNPAQAGVSVQVTSTVPIVAERPMYMIFDFGSGAVAGAHVVVGATQLGHLFGFAWASTLAGDNDYLTIQNPGVTDAHITATYYPGGLVPIVRTFTVGHNSRHTVQIFTNTEGAGAGYSPLGIVVSSDQPVLVEKPTYSSSPTTYGATDTQGYSPAAF